jgi:cephalosporin hydroxylase
MIDGLIDRAFALGMFQHRGEIEPFARWLLEQAPKNAVEIGSWKGGSSLLLSEIVSRRLVSVDLPDGPFGGATGGMTPEACRERNEKLASLNETYVGILGDSRDPETVRAVREALEGEPADLVFVDGDHGYEAVRADFLTYLPILQPGGWFAFHDVNDTPWHRATGCEVDRLWRELSGEKLEWNVRGDFGGIGAWRKPA